jgi:hypothetical protein
MSPADFNAFCTHVGLLKRTEAVNRWQRASNAATTGMKFAKKEYAKGHSKQKLRKVSAKAVKEMEEHARNEIREQAAKEALAKNEAAEKKAAEEAKKGADEQGKAATIGLATNGDGDGSDYEEEESFNSRVARERSAEKQEAEERCATNWQQQQEVRITEQRVVKDAAKEAMAKVGGDTEEGEGSGTESDEDGAHRKAARAKRASEAIHRVDNHISDSMMQHAEQKLAAKDAQTAAALWLRSQARKTSEIYIVRKIHIMRPGFVATLPRHVVDEIFTAANDEIEEENPDDIKAEVGTRKKALVNEMNDDGSLERFEFLEAIVRLAMACYFNENSSTASGKDSPQRTDAALKFVTEHLARVYFRIEADSTLSTGPRLGTRRFRSQIVYTPYTDAVMSCYVEQLGRIFRKYSTVGGRSNSFPSLARAKADEQGGRRKIRSQARTAKDPRHGRYMRWEEWLKLLQLAKLLPSGESDDGSDDGVATVEDDMQITPRIAQLSFAFATMLVKDELRTVNNTDPSGHAHAIQNAAQYATADGYRRSRLLSFPDFLEALCRVVAMLPGHLTAVVGGYTQSSGRIHRKRGGKKAEAPALPTKTSLLVKGPPHHVRLNSFLRLLVERLLSSSTKGGGVAQAMNVSKLVAHAQLKLLSAIRRRSLLVLSGSAGGMGGD